MGWGAKKSVRESEGGISLQRKREIGYMNADKRSRRESIKTRHALPCRDR